MLFTGGKPTRAQRANTKAVNRFYAMQSEQAAEAGILTENFFERRSNAIGQAAHTLTNTKAARRRRSFAEAFKAREVLKKELFIEGVFGIFMESLMLDDEFKYTYAGNFRNLVEDTINNMFESGQVTWKGIMENGSEAIQDIAIVCENIAVEKSQDKIKADNGDSDGDGVVGSTDKAKRDKKNVKPLILTPEDKGDFNGAIDGPSQAIATTVKNKVISVVKKEQDMADKEQELQDAISSKVNPKDDEVNTPVDGGVSDDNAVTGEEPEVEPNPSPRSESASLRVVRRPGKGKNYSLFKSMQLNIANKNLREMIQESKQAEGDMSGVKLDLDLVLAETIAYYTLLETLYTARVVDFSASEMRSFAKELVLK